MGINGPDAHSGVLRGGPGPRYGMWTAAVCVAIGIVLAGWVAVIAMSSSNEPTSGCGHDDLERGSDDHDHHRSTGHDVDHRSARSATTPDVNAIGSVLGDRRPKDATSPPP